MHQASAKRRLWILLILVWVSTGLCADNTDTKALMGTWKATIDYESYVLQILSADQLQLNGEIYTYSHRPGVVEFNYETYPYRVDGDTLYVTAEGEEHQFARVAPAPKMLDINALMGFWKSKTDWGTQYLHIVSDKELEFGGKRVAYTLVPGGVQANGTFHSVTLEGDKLTVTSQEEDKTVVFTRDHSVLLGTWVAKQDGRNIPLTFYPHKELSFDYQYAPYELVPGAIRVDYTDYPYRFEGKYIIGEVDGVEMKFQRDPAQLLGTWKAEANGRTVTLTFHSETQVEYEGQSAAYVLTPASIHVDDHWIPYRLKNSTLLIASPEEGEVTFKKVK